METIFKLLFAFLFAFVTVFGAESGQKSTTTSNSGTSNSGSECSNENVAPSRLSFLESSLNDMARSMDEMWKLMDTFNPHRGHSRRHFYDPFYLGSHYNNYHPRWLTQQQSPYTNRFPSNRLFDSFEYPSLTDVSDKSKSMSLLNEPEMRLIHDFPKVSSFSTDIVEKDGHYAVHADMPGLNKKDINVRLVPTSLGGCRLEIDAKREETAKEEKDDFVRKERQYGEYSRSFILPDDCDCDKSKVTANYKQGVLQIDMPKSEKTSVDKKEQSHVDVA